MVFGESKKLRVEINAIPLTVPLVCFRLTAYAPRPLGRVSVEPGLHSAKGGAIMSDTHDRPAPLRYSPRRHPRRFVLTDAGIIAAVFLGASLAVPIMYSSRFDGTVWAVSIVAFVGIPVLAGIVRGQPSFLANLTAGILLLACPIAYAVTDPLPVRFELLRDVLFLATGSTLTFISTGWTTNSARARQWGQVSGSAALSVLVAGLTFLMVSLFMYLE